MNITQLKSYNSISTNMQNHRNMNHTLSGCSSWRNHLLVPLRFYKAPRFEIEPPASVHSQELSTHILVPGKQMPKHLHGCVCVLISPWTKEKTFVVHSKPCVSFSLRCFWQKGNNKTSLAL